MKKHEKTWQKHEKLGRNFGTKIWDEILATKFWDPKIWSPRNFHEPTQKFELRPRTTTTRKSIEFCVRHRNRHPTIRPDGPEKIQF